MKILEEIDTLILPENLKDNRSKRKGLVKKKKKKSSGIRSWVWHSGAEHLPGDPAAVVYKLGPGQVRCDRKRLYCPEEQHHQLCPLWSTIYLIYSRDNWPIANFPTPTPVLSEKLLSLWSWVGRLSVFSLCLCGRVVQQPTFSGEVLPCPGFPSYLTFWCFLWAGEISPLSWASSRFIGYPGLQVHKSFFARDHTVP